MKLKMAIGGLVAAGCLVLRMTGNAEANNIGVTNIALVNQDVGAKTVNVAFDLRWDNSWRGSENWDAAWVFVKFRAPGSNDWQHGQLSTNSADHTPSANSTIAAVPDGKGVFVYRSSSYTGNVNYARTKLRWNYGSNGYSFAKGDLVEVSVQAIEMVYIPAGPFFLGSGGGELSHFYRYTDGSQSTNPFLVSSEDAAITVGTANGNLYYPSSTFGGDRLGTISNAFPKGYAAFYCMKYEISQGQYADFLNKLTAAQDATRYPNFSTYRYTIGGSVTNRIVSALDRACNYLSWADGIAYADWAGLRPITELEFEKACRGPANPVVGEFAWGTNTIMPDASRTLSWPEDGTETVINSTTLGGCNYGNKAHIGGDGGSGPLRAGIFATAGSGRVSAGAGYYGVMELSGNVWERAVTVGHPDGRKFTGTCGDGVLDVDGNATGNTDWPAGSSASGAGYRGGNWFDAGVCARVSDRFIAAIVSAGRTYDCGGRGVRPAP